MKNFLAEAMFWVIIFILTLPVQLHGKKSSVLLDILNLKGPCPYRQKHINVILIIVFLSRIFLGKGLAVVFFLMIVASMALSYVAGSVLLGHKGVE